MLAASQKEMFALWLFSHRAFNPLEYYSIWDIYNIITFRVYVIYAWYRINYMPRFEFITHTITARIVMLSCRLNLINSDGPEKYEK